ncbi:hypothetical protein CVD28_24540 [Bacillus sp. M6-12]|uniref:hypothetical protein n=1 Tax=Bacillus sp. M6-12 TaxID=2054166 RepID=UPI000C782CB7|nr:hypothetical protein [Bacillus sp. M6-12]PLS15051.1 hypothetical protein CVD28_24540 [Bacillus sp. M6-12]
MSLTRYYGTTDKLPNHFVELVMNEQKEIVTKLVYREDYSVIPFYKLEEEVRVLLEPMVKKDFTLLRGDDFKKFLNERERHRKIHCQVLNEEEAFKIEGGQVVYADELLDGRLYATYHFPSEYGYAICHYSEKNKNFIEQHFFTEEEMTCPSILYFLKNSIPKDKITVFDTAFKGVFYALYKTKDYFYIGEVEGGMLTDNIKIYDNDYVKVTENTEVDIIKEKINLYMYKLHIIQLAKTFIPTM